MISLRYYYSAWPHKTSTVRFSKSFCDRDWLLAKATCSTCLFVISSLYFFMRWLCCGVGRGGASMVLIRRPSLSIRRWSRAGSPPSGGGLWPFERAENEELLLVLRWSSPPRVTEYTRLCGPSGCVRVCAWGGGYFGGVFVWATNESGTSTAISRVSSSNSTNIVLAAKWAEKKLVHLSFAISRILRQL